MIGANADTVVGYLTANPPADFKLGDRVPYSQATLNPKAGPTISFSFSDLLVSSIAPKESSKTLYVLSQSPPGHIVGNVIDGYAHSGDVVGPIPEAVVPEPATFSLLASGFAALLAYACRRRKGAA